MNKIINVKRPERTDSRVIIGESLNMLGELIPTGRTVVITDANLMKYYTGILDKYETIILPDGEKNKTLDTIKNVYSRLLEIGADRNTYIVGFGGGIVTDMTGYIASTYMRGMQFGFVATTLLAQVDASVGGKNGVNFEGYKNIIGTFNQPDFVLCDPLFFNTLPRREFCAGIAEIIKCGLIADRELFEMFSKYRINDFIADKDLLGKAITASVSLKARVVEMDERENGERRKLNLGHTFAHAIEKSTDRFMHGEAVAIGLAMMARVSEYLGLISTEELSYITVAIENSGLPVESGIDIATLSAALKSDKKKNSDSIHIVLMKGIEDCEVRNMKFLELDDILGRVF